MEKEIDPFANSRQLSIYLIMNGHVRKYSLVFLN